MESLKLEALSAEKGLNFLPKLSMANGFQNHLRTRRIRPSFYGNYEGDRTMFPSITPSMYNDENDDSDCMDDLDDILQREKLETEKEKADKEKLSRDERESSFDQESLPDIQPNSPLPLESRKNIIIEKILRHKYVQQVKTFTETLSNQRFCKRFIESAQVVYAAIVWTMMLVFHHIVQRTKLNDMCYVMACMRNVNRQILWWMTLSKSGDVLHFARMVVATPLVFVVAIIGLLAAIYKSVQYNFQGFCATMRATVIWLRQIDN